MTNRDPKPPAKTPATLTAAILVGAAVIAILGTILPSLIGLSGTPALIMRVAFYVIAVVDVALAFWLRGKIRKARQASPSETVQRQ